jgi:hypothetical protein
MATLDNSNIVNGNTVETTDITQLYTALGTGNPGTITGLVMTGSLKGDVQGTSTNANFARINNNITSPTIYSVLFADSPVSSANKQIYADSGSDGSGMHYQPSTDTLTVTASFAVTASHALNAGGGSSLTMATTPDSQNPATSRTWIPIAGVASYQAGPGALVDLTQIFGFTPIGGFGVDLIITANEIVSPSQPAVAISPSLQGAILTFEGATGNVMYQGWYRT